MINGVADKFIDFAKEQCNANIKKYDREAYVADHNSLLTVYFLPALIETRYDSCEKLAKVVLEKWNSSITKYKLQIGTFSDIDASFKRKLCYITTAVCESLGKGDDCYELNILRDYRDGYLSNTEEGRLLIEEYYNIAPTIVNRINKTDNSGEVYSSIFTNYLSPCINYIEQGNNRECQDCYTEMVRVLQNKYMGF